MSRCLSGGGLATVTLFAVLAGMGCVRRTVTINSDPQGAAVILNDQRIGTTPVSRDFTWYGDYEIILQKEGYETLTTHQRINAPWYQLPPIDLITEAFTPFTIHDRRQMSFALEPAKPIERAQLIEDARQFRERALFESDTERQ